MELTDYHQWWIEFARLDYIGFVLNIYKKKLIVCHEKILNLHSVNA